MPAARKMTPAQVADARALYRQGWGIAQVIALTGTGCSVGAMHAALLGQVCYKDVPGGLERLRGPGRPKGQPLREGTA